MKRQLGAALLLAGMAAACASAPPCATAQSSDSEECAKPTGKAARARASTRASKPFAAIPIEDSSGHALQSFHAALRAAEEKRGQARILIYGASHVAADIYPDVLRTRLQNRFGEGGPGFIMPGKPLQHYSAPGITIETSTGWTGYHVKSYESGEDYYGLAGMYLQTTNPRRAARSVVVTKPHAGLSGLTNEIELYYLKQPDGGHLKVTIDGKTREISTASRTKTAGYERWELPDSLHRIEIVTGADGPVRIFGLSLDRRQPGVTIDAMGIPGARAKTQLLWNDAMYREQLARRHPDLVVLAYGTNEAGDDGQPIEEYASALRKVVARVRQAVPQASCLLVGPSDRPIRSDAGTYLDRPRTAQIINTQREVSSEFGCGFFDLVSFMGGPLSMLDWCDGEPPFGTQDHVHFTPRGYEALGNVLHDALMMGYRGPAPIVFGPRPLAPPGSTLSELNRDAREPSDESPEPASKPRRKVTSTGAQRTP